MGVSLSPEILFDLVLSIKACLVGIYYWLIFPIMWDINEIVNKFYKFFYLSSTIQVLVHNILSSYNSYCQLLLSIYHYAFS